MKAKIEIEQAFDDEGNKGRKQIFMCISNNSIWSFKGIPSDPQLTNEYYKNYNDFEIDSSPERGGMRTSMNATGGSTTRNSMSKTIGPRRRVTTAVGGRKLGATSRYMTNNMQRGAKTPAVPARKTSIGGSSSGQTISAAASKTFSGNQPSGSVAARKEYEQLIDAMQNALIVNKEGNCF